ncbi:MAG: 50S ribosomal protein L24 [Candidatus Colwellbacteria bacterium]|nr:50S ribosomal protein L24 [Candidatus Colwellbacteria bacterium]
MRILKGDKVMVMTGKEKGKTAKVLSVQMKAEKLILEGLNLYKKSVRPKKQGEKGQIVSMPKAMPASNVQIICGSCNKPVKIGIKIGDKNKIRYCKKCNATL